MAKVDIESLADPQDIFMSPAIMTAIGMFPSTADALRMLLVLIARRCDVTGSYQFLGVNPADDEVLQKIGACLQHGCTSFADAEAVFNTAVASVNAVINLSGPSIPSVTPSPAPHQPSFAPTSNGMETIDEIVEREVRKALSKTSAQASSSSAAQAYPTKTGTTTLLGAVTSHPVTTLLSQRVRWRYWRTPTTNLTVGALRPPTTSLGSSAPSSFRWPRS